MINPHGINGVLGKRWCSKRRKRTRKAVVSSSKKEKWLSEGMNYVCRKYNLWPLGGTAPFLSFGHVPRFTGKIHRSEWQNDIICALSFWSCPLRSLWRISRSHGYFNGLKRFLPFSDPSVSRARSRLRMTRMAVFLTLSFYRFLIVKPYHFVFLTFAPYHKTICALSFWSCLLRGLWRISRLMVISMLSVSCHSQILRKAGQGCRLRMTRKWLVSV